MLTVRCLRPPAIALAAVLCGLALPPSPGAAQTVGGLHFADTA